MRRVLDVSTGALNIAGSLCGIPFVGAAAIIVSDIVQACDEVKAQKVRFRPSPQVLNLTCFQKKSRQLSSRCVQLLNLLNDQAPNLEGSELQQITDEVIMYLFY